MTIISDASNETEKSNVGEMAESRAPDLRVETMLVADLIPYARNARTHPPEQVEQIARSIDEFGFVNPVLIDAVGALIAGHGRVLAAQARGLAEVPVIRLGHLSPAQVKALRIADNRIAENSGWDEQALRLELGELQLEGFADLELMGFDLGFLEGGGEGQGGARLGSLAEAFGIPPFSVLNAREGWWQDRKRAWLALGIQSELGRGEGMRASPGGSPQPTVNKKTGKIARSDSRGRVVPGTDAGQGKRKEKTTVVAGKGWADGGPARRDPTFYAKKRAWEKANGRKIGTAEFREKFWDGAA